MSELNKEVRKLIVEHNPCLESQGDLIAKIYQLGLEHGNHVWQDLGEGTQNKLAAWRKEQDLKVAQKQGEKIPYYGAIGGAYVYTYCATSLGVVVKVINDLTKETLDLTDYTEW